MAQVAFAWKVPRANNLLWALDIFRARFTLALGLVLGNLLLLGVLLWLSLDPLSFTIATATGALLFGVQAHLRRSSLKNPAKLPLLIARTLEELTKEHDSLKIRITSCLEEFNREYKAELDERDVPRLLSIKRAYVTHKHQLNIVMRDIYRTSQLLETIRNLPHLERNEAAHISAMILRVAEFARAPAFKGEDYDGALEQLRKALQQAKERGLGEPLEREARQGRARFKRNRT